MNYCEVYAGKDFGGKLLDANADVKAITKRIGKLSYEEARVVSSYGEHFIFGHLFTINDMHPKITIDDKLYLHSINFKTNKIALYVYKDKLVQKTKSGKSAKRRFIKFNYIDVSFYDVQHQEILRMKMGK